MLLAERPQPPPPARRAAMPSRSAAACHGLIFGALEAGAGAVSARNCSSAATIAAASVSEAGETISIRGLRGLRLPLALTR